MNRHDTPAMTALSLALLVALVLLVRLLVGPTGDGPHGTTTPPPYGVYMEEAHDDNV